MALLLLLAQVILILLYQPLSDASTCSHSTSPAICEESRLPSFLKQQSPLHASSKNAHQRRMADQKTVLITGCSRGIGLALAEEYINKGWQVLATCRSPDRAKDLSALLKKANQPPAVALDAADDGSILRAFQAVQQRGIGKLDLLFHNAGIAGPEDLLKTTRAELDAAFSTNVSGPMVITQTFLPLLKAAPQPKVVFMSTIMSSLEMNMGGGMTAYRITKTALNALVRQFAGDVSGLIVLAMHPGWVQTDLGYSVGPAPLSPAASCRGMYDVIEAATRSSSGKFIDYQGHKIKW